MAHPSLTEISNLHASDKGTMGPSNAWMAHNYTDIYEAALGRSRFEQITMLEIGLGVTGDRWDARIVHGKNTGGASIKMWHDYFEKGQIYGIDINPADYLDNDRISTFIVDQGSTEELQAFWEQIGGLEFDFIIDDGSHRPDHQQISLGNLFGKLRPGGLYFIEDLLSNGRGDGSSGRTACDHVLNTRAVLKEFAKTGAFGGPNAIGNESELAEQIADITFHSPKIRVVAGNLLSRRLRRFLPFLPKPPKKQPGYISNSEKLCIITKRCK